MGTSLPVIWASWIVIAWGVSQARPFLVPLLLAALVAFLMNPVAVFLRRKKVPEWAAITVAALLLLLPVLGLTGLLVREITVLLRDAPRITASLREHWAEIASSSLVQRFGLSDYLDASALADRFGEEAGKGLSMLLDGLKAVASAGVQVLIVLAFAILMLASRRALRASTDRWAKRPETLDEIIRMIEKFLSARLGIALGVAVLDYVILQFARAHFSILLAFILGVSTLVPIVGFILAVIPPIALMIALGRSTVTIVTATFFLYLVATTESHFVAPKILGKSLNLNLLATFVVLFGGELLWGMWGMVLAIPVTGIIRIALIESDRYRPWAAYLSDTEKK